MITHNAPSFLRTFVLLVTDFITHSHLSPASVSKTHIMGTTNLYYTSGTFFSLVIRFGLDFLLALKLKSERMLEMLKQFNMESSAELLTSSHQAEHLDLDCE